MFLAHAACFARGRFRGSVTKKFLEAFTYMHGENKSEPQGEIIITVAKRQRGPKPRALGRDARSALYFFPKILHERGVGRDGVGAMSGCAGLS